MSFRTVWRISPAERSATLFSGEGGLYAEARWHPKGHRIVYTAESRALAALEIMANVPGHAQLHRHAWVIAEARIPLEAIEVPARYPEAWRLVPAHDSTRLFGQAWLVSLRSVALRVPSAVIAGEFNYLLNPLHPDFSRLSFGAPEAFRFDPRF